MPAQRKPEISVVIPVFNNGVVLAESLLLLVEYFRGKRLTYEIICVDDCSEKPVVLPKGLSGIRLIRLEKNIGQQRAIAHGLLAASAEIAVTTDADLPIAPGEFMRLYQTLKNEQQFDLVLGARSGFNHKSRIRGLSSRLVGKIIRLLFHFALHDFGCGTNAVRKSLVQRFEKSELPVSPIKLAMITLSSGYAEIALPMRTKQDNVSAYTFWRLFMLVLGIFWFRLRAAGILARKPR